MADIQEVLKKNPMLIIAGAGVAVLGFVLLRNRKSSSSTVPDVAPPLYDYSGYGSSGSNPPGGSNPPPTPDPTPNPNPTPGGEHNCPPGFHWQGGDNGQEGHCVPNIITPPPGPCPPGSDCYDPGPKPGPDPGPIPIPIPHICPPGYHWEGGVNGGEGRCVQDGAIPFVGDMVDSIPNTGGSGSLAAATPYEQAYAIVASYWNMRTFD